MDTTPSAGRLLRFGLFQLDPSSGELLRNGHPVRLQDQPFRILLLLLERAGQIVTREELKQNLWPSDTFVEFEDSLNTAVKRLRYALADAADNPTFIETIPRRGYRFIAPVTEAPAAVLEKEVDPPPQRRKARTAAIGVAALAISIVSAVAFTAFIRSSPRSSIESRRPVRLVVLPLKNLSNDPEQQYFADGMTEELITRLASLDGLRVISRTSAMQFKDTKKLLPEIARQLNVDAVVEGSVLHSGNRVRITAQLIHAATDQHLWAESYEGDEGDVLHLQNEVAHDIAEKVTSKLRPASASAARRTERINPEAHRAYLRGRYRWHTRRLDELQKAVGDFERAIALEPGYALAYAGLADVYLVLPLMVSNTPYSEAYPKARIAAEKALQLDPTLAEAHNSSAYVKMYLDWDFAGAERGFRRAIELNPNYATAHQWYAELLALQSRHQEALAEMRLALELDPLSAVMHHQAGQCHQQARRYDDAIQEYRHAMAIDPAFERISAGAMGNAYLRKGAAVAAIESMAAAWRRPSGGTDAAVEKLISEFSNAVATGGVRGFYQLQAERGRKGTWSHPYWFAGTLAAAGHDDEALEWLERSYKERDHYVLNLDVDPEWDHLRSDPRFVAIRNKVGIAR